MFLSIGIGFAVKIRKNSKVIVVDASVNLIRAVATNSLNDATTKILSDYSYYGDLYTVKYSANGEVTAIESNQVKINTISREVANLSQRNLDKIGIQEIFIPCGTFTGMALLTGVGPPVRIRVLPIGASTCEFVSEFVKAGINQTLHRVYLDVYASIEVVTSLDAPTIEIKAEILIYENMIIGKVPDVYAVIGSEKSMLDLVP